MSSIQHRVSGTIRLKERQLLLEIFCGLRGRDGLRAHRQESAEEQNRGAPDLGVSETFAINPSGEPHCTGGAEQLERLGERYNDLSDCYIIQDMGERYAAHGGDDENQVNVRSRVKGGANFSKLERERKQEDRSDQADQPETAN